MNGKNNNIIFLCDNDSTFMREEGLDEIAKFVSPELFERISNFTHQQMNGDESISFRQSLGMRVEMLLEQLKHSGEILTKKHLQEVAKKHLSFSAGVEPFLQKLIRTYGSLKNRFYIVSGGFFEVIAPKILELDIPKNEQKILQDQILANYFLWDKIGNICGVDWEKSVMWKKNAKGEMAEGLANTLFLKETGGKIIGIGDGSNDISLRSNNGIFVAFIGNVRREKVIQKADMTIDHFSELDRFVCF